VTKHRILESGFRE